VSLILKNLNPVIGSEVVDFNLATASDEQMADVKAALDERGVLVFRNQQLTQDQHRALGRVFGAGKLHQHALAGGETPDILKLKTDENSKFVAGDGWHADVTCDKNPIACSMLYMKQVPASGGGDTLFANMNRAYETLSQPIKELIKNLSAFHDGAYPWKTVYGIPPEPGKTYPSCSHPVVIKHPDTGKPLLFVNSGFTTHIEGLPPAEGKYILDLLLNHVAATPLIQCRVQWGVNTLVMWDNVQTQHHAVWDYYPEARSAERVSVVGTDLESYF